MQADDRLREEAVAWAVRVGDSAFADWDEFTLWLEKSPDHAVATDPQEAERIEVLRGPQGTLYGVTAVNGVVRVLTAEPDLQRFGTRLRSIGCSPATR